MEPVNESQIQSTNDASTVSKCSAVSKNYFEDDFIQEFVAKKKSRAALIHLGYYTRAVILNKLITDFIQFLNLHSVSKFQIISLGAGFDTTYWRLSQANLLHGSLFIEIDFPNVIQRKVSLIKESMILKSYLEESSHWGTNCTVKRLNSNYYLLEADLSEVTEIERLFNDINVNYDIPTLFLSECVITYMKESDSGKLINWMSKKFKNCGFINYEQIHPDDGFGQVMLKHFDKLQSSLFSVSKYPDCKSHYFRFKNHGFENAFCLSEWDALTWLTSEEERKRVLVLELFDEFEEFHLKCAHYVIAVAGNGMSSDWINSFFFATQSLGVSDCRPCLNGLLFDSNLELFRHLSCNVKGVSFLFGGCSRQNRSSKVYQINYADKPIVKSIKSEQNLCLDMVYGTAAYFELNKQPFVCLYGGRKSPDKVWNNGSPVIYQIIDNEFLEKLIISTGNPVPRYRTAMVSLNSAENEVHCWVFGGRTTDLNETLQDFWKLRVSYNEERKLTAEWVQQEKNGGNWPCSRMSHSLTAHPEKHELFLIGGLTMDSSSVLNDMWKWSCRSESWQQVHVTGSLLPRYGHTSHLKDDVIYLLGGVNTLAGTQPGLARIDLQNLTVTEFQISVPSPETVLLFNHTSEIVGDDENAEICLIGGGGNCFSFGTHLNRSALHIKLKEIS